MPPPKKKGTCNQVGRTLMRRHQGFGPRGKGPAETAPEPEKPQLTSVLEMNSLEDFLSTAMIAQKDFTATRERDLVILDRNSMGGFGSARQLATQDAAGFKQLKMPRRPQWHSGMTAAELDRAEKDAFLTWRRYIADLEEVSGDRAKVTPFEKNLEVWRQLWRVIERSHVVVQIVDARDPLFYYSEDLHVYAEEMQPPRARLILINKADYLTRRQRRMWAELLKSKGWEYAFFSARREQERLTSRARVWRDRHTLGTQFRTEIDSAQDAHPCGNSEEEEMDGRTSEEGGSCHDGPSENEEEEEGSGASTGRSALLSREALTSRLIDLAGSAAPEESQTTVGMVGFPNVGKSSVINVLLGITALDHTRSRVAVSSTPGKTKHFQTLPLSEETMLCDCPGLVFPSFVATSADMICAGVLSTSQLRDHVHPVEIVRCRIGEECLRGFYGLKEGRSGQEAGARQFLEDLCEMRGFKAQGSGVADVNRAAKMVLGDYVSGKLLYCHAPPGLGKREQEVFLQETRSRKGQGGGLESALLGAREVEEGLSEEGKEDQEPDAANHEFSGPEEEAGVTGGESRRLKSAKRWGKKGRKFQNKIPYEAEDLARCQDMGLRTMGRKLPLRPNGADGR